ncbi:MAG: NAD-dependent epimerase/dehydratase family protein [Candidatus Omnitrophica bacterium]|nr:NAD-dependent epimerase/dehydratase family protein [Candidatus Omnitrophota bacterium]
MKIMIAGVDGYLGWALAQHLTMRGHEVSGFDTYARRDWVAEVGSQSATPIVRMTERLAAFRREYGVNLQFRRLDIMDYNALALFLRSVQPDAIVHLAEMPSAPYSMMDAHHAVYTQSNNVLGTLNLLFAIHEHCPNAHLVKLGTMGEYGTPNIDIPEGFFEIEYRGRKATLPFPRQAGSWYHQSKVHDSHNVAFACKIWGLRSTDIMQGVVFGTRIENQPEDERLLTRFDFDQSFGTAINRYCAQAVIGEPLSVFGAGGQSRGFLPLKDSMQCISCIIENPAQKGEYRVLNQFDKVFDVTELAEKVQQIGKCVGLKVEVNHIENPRMEAESHYYNPDREGLLRLGYKPTEDIDSEIENMLEDLMQYRERIEARAEALIPDIRWDGTIRKSEVIQPKTVTSAK